MKFYELICEDYSRLGGPMGTEYTSEIFRKAFSFLSDAKKYAENDHKKRDNRQKIEWFRDSNSIHSGDLLSHAYTIETRNINKIQ